MTDGNPARTIVGVPKETTPDERRVALVPDLLPKLTSLGVDVLIQDGAGILAGFSDSSYTEKNARLEPKALAVSDIVLKVQPPTPGEAAQMKEGSVLIGFLQPYTNAAGIKALAQRKVTAFSMELMPRITRAQPMDALSAMSTISGYKAVLIAATHLP